MNFRKKNIIKNFSRAALTYDKHADLQKEVCRELLFYIQSPAGASFKEGFISPHSGEGMRILDAGCGTGAGLSLLEKLHPGAFITGCDIAHPMLLAARRKNTPAKLITSDCEALPLKGASFDIVFSSLTLQWVSSMVRAFSEVHRVLKPGGAFIFSTLGPDTLFELRAALSRAKNGKGAVVPSFMTFPAKEVLVEGLKRAGFECVHLESRPGTRDYKNMAELLKTLKKIGASNPHENGSSTLARGLVLREASGIYERDFPSVNGRGIRATYEILYTVARKA